MTALNGRLREGAETARLRPRLGLASAQKRGGGKPGSAFPKPDAPVGKPAFLPSYRWFSRYCAGVSEAGGQRTCALAYPRLTHWPVCTERSSASQISTALKPSAAVTTLGGRPVSMHSIMCRSSPT